LIFLGIWLTLMVAGRSQLFRDPGTLWHPVLGRQILATGRLPRVDSFSFTRAGEPWIDQWWLGDCALALADRASGLDGLLLMTVTALAAFFAWAAARMIRRGVHPLLAVFLTVLAMAAASYHFHPRPHLATILLMGVTMALLCDVEAGRTPLDALAWLFPLDILWANVHGGMVGGVATLALAVTGWGLIWAIGRPGPVRSWRQLLALVALVGGCGFAALVNPYGPALPEAWFALMGSPVLSVVLDEHRPLLDHPGGWIVLPLAGFYLVALLGVLPRAPRVTWCIPLAWLALAFTRIRHGPLFAVTALIALGDLMPHVRWAGWLERQGSELFRIRPQVDRPGGRPWIIPAILVVTTFALQVAGVRAPVVGRGWARLDPAAWPVDLLPDLHAHEHDRPDGTPIFNEMSFGGFLIAYTPGYRVFIDDRAELYGDEGLLAYARAAQIDPGQVDRWADRYGFDLALTVTGSAFDRYLRHARTWALIRETRAASLYRRNSGP
jgi:hypothetical protein